MTPTHAISADEARRLLAEDRERSRPSCVFEWSGNRMEFQHAMERWGCLCSLAIRGTKTCDYGPAGRHVDGCSMIGDARPR